MIFDHKDGSWVTCRLCGQDDTDHYLYGWNPAGPRFQVVRCQQCGFLYTNPRPPTEALGDYYADDYYAYSTSTATKHQVKQAVMGYQARRWLRYPEMGEVLDKSRSIRYLTPFLRS